MPDEWDLTGFSGDNRAGYVRIDDGAEQAAEIKWATESGKSVPDVEVRRETYFRALKAAARKKKLELTAKEAETPRAVQRPERTAVGFTWVGDRKGIGTVWYCSVCKRVVIAQVLGNPSGKGGLGTISERVLGSLNCHSSDPEWQTWALYDLVTAVPAGFKLVAQQLMNVYLRLSFANGTQHLSVEQWAVANVARRDAYMDTWLAANSKGELARARYTAEESGAVQGHTAIQMTGGPAFGMPMIETVREAARQFRPPATRFTALAWQCDVANKIYLVESLQPGRAADVVTGVAERTLCHRAEDPRSEKL